MISRGRKGKHDFPPAVCEFRKTVEKQDARPSLRLESCLQNMDRETVDVFDHTGTDAGWQHGITVGRKVA
jgi:hypothetical protein